MSEYQNPNPIRFSSQQQFYEPDIYQQIKENYPEESTQNIFCFSDAVQQVTKHYTLPHELYPYQAAWVNAFGDNQAAGMYFEVGAGKSLTATVAALYHRLHGFENTIVLMPPILLPQWESDLKKIPEIGEVQIYSGSPAERKKIPLDVDFLLMSIEVFKNDFERIFDFFYDKKVTLLVDEAASVKNICTGNYKAVKAFYLGRAAFFLDHKARTKKKRTDSATKRAHNQASTEATNALQRLLKDSYGAR